MNTRVLSILLAILGQVLIIGFALAFFDDFLTPDVLWLDIAVTSVAYWLWAANLIAQPRLDDQSQKQMGGLGVRLWSSTAYSVITLGFMVVCMFMQSDGSAPAFKWQLIFQVAMLFLLAVGLLFSAKSVEKTAAVYTREHQSVTEKTNLRIALINLADNAADNPQIPRAIVDRLRRVADDARYLSPSSSPAPLAADDRLRADAQDLSLALRDCAMNSPQIAHLTERLERDMQRRKQI